MIAFGNIMLWGGLLAALISLIAYVGHARGNTEARSLARAAFASSAAAILAASVVLLWAFLQGRYDIAYVAEYSSRDLPLIYRVSAFWAGQEGSFLLWALMGAVMGLSLIRKACAWEGSVMAPFAGTQAFLLLLLAIKSPFRAGAEALADGRGLNPLLQDPWMAIHPPAIFLGYAALAVPFAFAIAALFRRDYDRWVIPALPWTLFAWVTLGSGIFIGGYWAYRVLGWGGYWGWDPVENASLIPWLLCTALLHGMIMQRVRGSLKRGNFLLAIVSFVMVLYGTFLTRSGVLKDFSVHSFVDPGMALYWTLLGGVLLSLVGPLLLLLTRVRQIRSTPTYDDLLSRDFALFLGTLVLCISAAIVTIGTSAPLITTLLGKPASVQPAFYNRTHVPVGVLMGLLLGVAPLLAWKQIAMAEMARRVRVYLVVAILGTVVAAAAGVHNPWMLLLVGASVLGFAVNAVFLGKALKGMPLSTGGYLTHVGFALMLVGIVGSSVYSGAKKLSLQPGQSGEALGFRVTYQGSERPSEGQRQMKLTVAKGGSHFAATPKMVHSPQMDSWVHSPAIKRYWLQDLYISPVELRDSRDQAGQQAQLGRGESAKMGGYTFTFERFDMSGHGEGGMSVGAVLKVKGPDGKSATITPTTAPVRPNEFQAQKVKVPGTDISVALTRIMVPKIVLEFAGLPEAAPAGPKEEAVIEVSNKPLINLLWLGTILVMAGGLVAGARRARESAREDDRSDEGPADNRNDAVRHNGKRVVAEARPGAAARR